jgi:hypothetical protein
LVSPVWEMGLPMARNLAAQATGSPHTISTEAR